MEEQIKEDAIVKKILVDIHEDKKVIKLLEENEVPYEIQALPIGDYIIGDLIIERKSINDLISSSYGHLQEQVKNMLNNQDQFKHVIIAIVGAYDDLFWMHFKANENSYYGMLSSLTIKYKVSQIHFKRSLQFVKYLKYCLEKSNNNSIDFTKIKRLDFKDDTSLSLLCALPNISQTKARKILEKFNVKVVLEDKENNLRGVEDLEEIDGIGKKMMSNLEKYFY